MTPFPFQLPRALRSRPGPGPGCARSLLHRSAAIQSNSGASDAAVLSRPAGLQVCHCSQGMRWPSTTNCSGCRETRHADAGAVRQWWRVVAQWEGLSAAPVSRRGEGHATLHSSTATDPGTGISPWPGSWRRSLHRSAAIQSNSGASDAAVLSRPAGLPGVSVLSESAMAKYYQLQRVPRDETCRCRCGCGDRGMVDEAAAHVRGFEGP